MHCITGERFGERQLFDHKSSLSRQGRDLAAQMETATGIPFFYYLHKIRSRGFDAELKRRCPNCEGVWRLEESQHLFDFRCDPCRLLSAIAAM